MRELLPQPLQRVIPVTFIGYAIINGSAFALDMLFLSIIARIVELPYSVSFSIGYALASIYAFFLNRWLNFREHGDLGKQSGKYTFVIVSNYLIWIVGFASLLDLWGVQIQVARVIAACLEGIYIYLLLRLWVFPRHREEILPDEVDADAV
ncbi:MAG: GtrA family protein [Propionibacteriaceae bacterium]|nr:GtrA family protein [Propionibacteriaceae bacterium]